jgi:hypothetical protein
MTGGRKTMSKSKLLAAVLALAHLTCAGVPLTAPSGSSLKINANPKYVAANGGTSSITAIVVEPAGTFVPDGTSVFFVTNLGRIEAEVKTKNGFAYTTFISDSRSGIATVQAFSGGPAPAPSASASTTTGLADDVAAATRSVSPAAAVSAPLAAAAGTGADSVLITVGSANPKEVILTADPRRITEPRNSTLTANVYDAVGNPVTNVPVIFSIVSVSGGLNQEALDSGSQPRYTDTNGQAHDVLRTSQNRADPQKQVNVIATIPVIGDSAPVAIFIN